MLRSGSVCVRGQSRTIEKIEQNFMVFRGSGLNLHIEPLASEGYPWTIVRCAPLPTPSHLNHSTAAAPPRTPRRCATTVRRTCGTCP